LAFCLVIGAFLFQIIEAWRARKPPPIIALWWLIAVLMVGAWLPFARPRYALPVIAPSVILVCSACGQLAGLLRRRKQRDAAHADLQRADL